MSFLSGLGKVLGGVGKVASFIPGVGTIGGAVLGGLGGLAEGKGLGGALSGAAAGAIPGGGGGLLKTIGGGLLKAAPAIMGGISMVQGAKKQGQADKMAADALRLKQQQYQDFAPIRALGIQGLQNTQRPDLTSIYQNKQNPFA